MRIGVLLVICLALIALVGCSSVQVSTDYDPNVDFSQYKTFSLPTNDRPPDDALAQNPLVAKRIELAVSRELEAKGFKKVDTGVPDLVVITYAGVQEKMQVNTYGSGYYGGYYGGYGYYDPWWGPYGQRTDVSYYDEGTLVIDLVDADDKELVWRGLGTKILEGATDPEKVQANVDKMVAKMMASFPPGSAKK